MTDRDPIFDPDHRGRAVVIVALVSLVIVGLIGLVLADVAARSA